MEAWASSVASWSIYAATGSPHLPAQPLQARLDENPEHATIAELVSRAENHLANNPEDGRGWDVLAPIYYRFGRYNDAVVAYRSAIRAPLPLLPRSSQAFARGYRKPSRGSEPLDCARKRARAGRARSRR